MRNPPMEDAMRWAGTQCAIRNPPMEDAMRWLQAQRSLTVERVSVRRQDARGYYTMAERQRDRQRTCDVACFRTTTRIWVVIRSLTSLRSASSFVVLVGISSRLQSDHHRVNKLLRVDFTTMVCDHRSESALATIIFTSSTFSQYFQQCLMYLFVVRARLLWAARDKCACNELELQL